MSVRKTTISQEEVSVPSLDTDTSIDVVTVSDNIPLLQNQQTNNESVAVHNAHNYQGISSAAASSGMANVPVNSDLAYDIVISSTSTEKHPLLQHLNVKVHDVLNAFDAVPGKYQLDALDILQSMINHVMQKITSGRISAVKFVPIENTSKDIIVVKQEPIELNSPSTSPPPAEHNDSDLMATIGAIEYQQPGAEQSPAPVMMVKHEPFCDEGPLAQSSPIIGKRASSKNDEIVNTNHGIAKIKSSSNAKAKGAKKTKSTAKSTKSPKKLPVLKIKLTPPKQKQGKSTEKTSESASGKSMRRALHMDGRTSTRNSEHIESDRNVIKTARHPKTSTTCTNAQELQDNFIDDLLNIDVIKETQELVEECLDNDETKFDNHIMVSRLNGPLTLKPVKDFKTTEEIMSMFPEEVWTKRPGNRKYDKKCKYKCDQCPYSTNKKDHMNVHKVAHTKEKRFHCAECDKYFTAANSLKRHLMIHSNERNHPCPICDKRFYTISELRAHAVTHTGEKPHQCSLCEKSYTLSANLRRHMRVHTGEMPYKCDICDNVAFRDYTSLKNHKLKHSGEKPHTCEVCGKRFRTSSDIIRHRRIHSNIKEYTCDKCGKAFKQSATLTAHQKVHTDIYPFKCDLCPKSFRSKGSLQHHIRWHAGVKPYKCDHCNKSFSTKIYLGYHQVLHTSQKPFQCRICKKPFNQISNLRRHEQFVHSKLKKYKCRYCPKTFKYTNSLTYHEGTHTGVQLVCEKCGVSFRAPSTMRKHTKICTGEEIIPKRRGSSGKKISKVTKGASHKNINGRVHKTNNIKTKVIKQPRLFMEKLSPEGFGISNNISAAVSDVGTEIMNIHDIKDEPLDIKLTGKRVGESTVDLELMMSPLPNHETSDHI